MKKICILTGSRAEYGLLKPVIEAVSSHAGLKLHLIAAGMHLSREFGHSATEIKKDGFTVRKYIRMNPPDDTSLGMVKAIGRGIRELGDAFSELRPDALIILGDRIEALAGTIAAGYMNIAIAHIHGGDSAQAGLDESARHAITKFAHIHFPATRKSAERIKKMGEEPWRIHVVGAPALDTILNVPLLTRDELAGKYRLPPNEPYILVVQHSVSTSPEKAGMQIVETLEAIKKLSLRTIIIYPNSDAGGREIIGHIKCNLNIKFISAYRNLPHTVYLSLLKYASALVGNSSSGIIESSSFKIPVVNIGDRQKGRERSTNVLDCRHDRSAIKRAIERCLYDKGFMKKVKRCRNPYGEGKAGQKIADILNTIEINKKLIEKKLSY